MILHFIALLLSWQRCTAFSSPYIYGHGCVHAMNGRPRISLQSTAPLGDFDDAPRPDIEDALGAMEDEEDEVPDEEIEAELGDWDERVARLNTVHLVGRIGNKPEPRYFDDGNLVLNLSLASTRKLHYAERKAENIRSGEEETDWYGLEIWGQTAEFVTKYVTVGARVGVIGSLQVDEWNDKETGEKRSRAKVVVREFDILETKAEADLRRSNQRGPSFYTNDDDDEDSLGPSVGGMGGFFD